MLVGLDLLGFFLVGGKKLSKKVSRFWGEFVFTVAVVFGAQKIAI